MHNTIAEMATPKLILTLRQVQNPAERRAFCAYTIRKYGLPAYSESAERLQMFTDQLYMKCAILMLETEDAPVL